MWKIHIMYILEGKKKRKKEKTSITWPCIENLRWVDLTWGLFEWNGLFGCAPGCWECICTGACLLGYLRFWMKDLVVLVWWEMG